MYPILIKDSNCDLFRLRLTYYVGVAESQSPATSNDDSTSRLTGIASILSPIEDQWYGRLNIGLLYEEFLAAEDNE